MANKKKINIRATVVAWMINKSVPLLNLFRRPTPFPYTLNQLRDFPKQSLGAETAAFLDKRNFNFLPQYETHDVFHTLLGYGTTTTGELRLQAFMWGNKSSSIAGRILFIIGSLTLPELWSQLRDDFQRGRRAQKVADLNIPILLDKNINGLRSEVGV